MKKAVLVRVGIDSSEKSGKWNAPVNPGTGEFAYVPIREDEGEKDGIKKKPLRPGYEVSYEQFKKPCDKLGRGLRPGLLEKGIFAHLDPDFRYLTYGDEDNKSRRLRKLELKEDDILAFYAGLKPPNAGPGGLIYALIGLYVLGCDLKRALDIQKENWYRNAHTRRQPKEDDIVVFGKKGKSGRLEKCIPIGKPDRKGWYYLESGIQKDWGEPKQVSLQFGYLPALCHPERFYEWFIEQNIPLVPRNNLD